MKLRPAAFTLPHLPATIPLITQEESLGGSVGPQPGNVCLRRLWKTRGEVAKKKQKPASFPIRNWAKFVFIRANRGKQPKWMANTRAHTAGSSLGVSKRTPATQQHAGKQANKREHAHTTDNGVREMHDWIFYCFFLLGKIKKNA